MAEVLAWLAALTGLPLLCWTALGDLLAERPVWRVLSYQDCAAGFSRTAAPQKPAGWVP